MRSGTARRAVASTALLLLATAGAATAIGRPAAAPTEARPQPAAPAPAATQPAAPAAADARDADRAAVREAFAGFVKAFESRDAKALAGHWTTEGEYENAEGVTVRGREALEKGFAAFFDRTPEVKAEVHPEALRFLGAIRRSRTGRSTSGAARRSRPRGPATTPCSCARTASGSWPGWRRRPTTNRRSTTSPGSSATGSRWPARTPRS